MNFLKNFKLFILAVVAVIASSCTDNDGDVEFLFDRETTDVSVLRSCEDPKDTSSCYRIRLRYPMETENLSYIHMWIDTNVVDDTSKAVTSKQIEQADASFEYPTGTIALFDTIDVTEMVKKFLDTYDSVQVAFYCEYTDDEDPGSVQRVFIHFGDDMSPAHVVVYDSVWTNGALFEWYRPTDQVDYYKPAEMGGPIAGYNVVIYSPDKNEDMRKLSVRLIGPDGNDFDGSTYYKRHARFRTKGDSLWVDTVAHGDAQKNTLHLAVLDGKGFNFEEDTLNRFRLIIEGLNSESQYTIGVNAFDSSGNSSNDGGQATVEQNQMFKTTDSIAPVIGSKIYTIEDSDFPGYAKLDSNNRLRLFWSRSADPKQNPTDIKSDTVVIVPDTCNYKVCYDTLGTYIIDHYNQITKKWESYSNVGGSDRYADKYVFNKGTFIHADVDAYTMNVFVTDTVRWVSPGDTLIIRIRAVDKSGYYSVALIDTIAVSPGALAKEVECPAGFLAVQTTKDSIFCMEKYEHQDENGKFVNNILYSDAIAACNSVSASGFKVSLCKERDWELVCLSGGTLSYGVVEESVTATEYLFGYCNVSTNDSLTAADINKRDYRCTNPNGIKDMPGQYQEWVLGSQDSAAVVKGGSYKIFNGLDRESISLCTNRSSPYYTRLKYTTKPVYLYREGTTVDTVFEPDTNRTLWKVLKKNDFKDSLQFFTVKDTLGNKIGVDYAPYSEYKKGGAQWLKKLANGLVYEPDHIEVVFLTGERIAYRAASKFYKSAVIGFRCCAYPESE